MKTTLTFYTDPGHGWLHVQMEDIKTLGIEGDISKYSYRKDDDVYLEEDCDAPKFIKALRARTVDFSVTEENLNDGCFIRSLQHYRSTK